MQNIQITQKQINGYDDYNYQIQTNKDVSFKQEQLHSTQQKEEVEKLSTLSSEIEYLDNKKLVFSINEKTNQIIAKIIDVSTEEVIREIPSEKIVEMIASMCERAGIFIDKKL